MARSCVFCPIIAERTRLVVDEPQVAAFLDHRPLFPGHLLICPREHVMTLDELPGEQLQPLFTVVQRGVRAMQQVMGASGAFVAQNNIVSQSVPHLHVHVVPRTKGDGLRGFFWPRVPYDDTAHHDRVRDELRAWFAANP